MSLFQVNLQNFVNRKSLSYWEGLGKNNIFQAVMTPTFCIIPSQNLITINENNLFSLWEPLQGACDFSLLVLSQLCSLLWFFLHWKTNLWWITNTCYELKGLFNLFNNKQLAWKFVQKLQNIVWQNLGNRAEHLFYIIVLSLRTLKHLCSISVEGKAFVYGRLYTMYIHDE